MAAWNKADLKLCVNYKDGHLEESLMNFSFHVNILTANTEQKKEIGGICPVNFHPVEMVLSVIHENEFQNIQKCIASHVYHPNHLIGMQDAL